MMVVVAAVLSRGRRVLIARRPDDKHLGGLWEFPGGKLEDGETPEAALKRELREELGVDVRVGRIYAAVRHTYPERDVAILFYRCRTAAGRPHALEGQTLCWALRSALRRYQFAPADRPVVRRLSRGHRPPGRARRDI
ncbi:MAG: 8-oxo-dGTP diphosphatase MutT [Clostridiales bacterium]|nr:8-oxo-dGTP diphosphatase MutT [Clostridiales bacterium]